MTNQKSRQRTWVIALVSFAALAVFGTVVLIGLGVYDPGLGVGGPTASSLTKDLMKASTP